jgi:hypothetical protein
MMCILFLFCLALGKIFCVISKPLAAAASKVLFRAFFLVLSMYFIVSAGISTHELNMNRVVTVDSFRLRVLGLRNLSLSPNLASVSSVGLLQDGCPVSPVNLAGVGETEALISRSTGMNGYYFVTGNGSLGLDPVRWVAEAVLSNQRDWTRVGASVWVNSFFSFDGGTVGPCLYPWLSYATTSHRGFRVDLDMRPSWPEILISMTWGYEWAVCLFLSAVAGMLHHEKFVHPLFVAAMTVDVIMIIAAAVGFYTREDSLQMIRALLYLPSQVQHL